MAAEEDKKFDVVLGGFLVNDLRVRAGHPHCPESDILAAYHERSLLPEEMNSWKEHIVGCARCQAILSELEATESIPLQAPERDEILVQAAQPSPVARQDQNAVVATVQKKNRITSISRGVRWQWLAPAGALAAGLLIWVALHEERLTQLKTPAEVKMARAEPPSTTAPQAMQQAPASTSLDQTLSSLSKDQAANGRTGSATKSLTEELKQVERYDSRARRRASPKLPADKEAGAREEALRDSALAENRIQNKPTEDAKAGVAGAVSETVEVQAPAANAQMQNQNQLNLNQVNAQKVGGPTPPTQAQGAAKKAKSESAVLARAAAAPPPPAPAPSAAFSDTAASRGLTAGALNPQLIVSANKKALWRAGHAGMIEFSTDAGASWSRQNSNVLVDLTAGSAPSDKVCWVVGRTGTILLTADSGSHWVIVHAPLDEDLGGVRATDALHATIWNSFNTKIFETTDGGITWKPVPNP